MIPDWQLPPGVDRGLWDYLHAADMVAAYDEQMRASPLAVADMAFCEKAFTTPGRLIDLGCGTGRLCSHFALKGFECVGVDLSEEMLAKARENAALAPQPPLLKGEGEKELQHLSKADSTSPTALPLPHEERVLGGEGRQPTFVKANLIDLTELLFESFDYAACLFSTLGMVRGHENRAKVIANACRLLKPGGRFALHVHNRYFQGLGWKRVLGQATKTMLGKGGEITMSQAYGGAPLTLHHFRRREAVQLLEANGFRVREVLAIGVDGKTAWPWWRVYGWLILAERPG